MTTCRETGVLASYTSIGYPHQMPRKPKPISHQLIDAIESSSMTRYRISQETGISEGQLSRFVHGQANLSLTSIDLLGEVLELEVKSRRKKRKGN